MKTLKLNSKKAQLFIYAYKRSRNIVLGDCYKDYSNKKQIAFNECIAMKVKENGYDMRIISFNTFGFTVMWQQKYGWRIETPKSSYRIIDDLPF